MLSVTVKAIVSPTFGVGFETVLPRARSAYCGFVDVVALLFAGFGSNWSLCETDAVLPGGLGEITVAVIVRVCGDPTLTVPTVHTPEPLL